MVRLDATIIVSTHLVRITVTAKMDMNWQLQEILTLALVSGAFYSLQLVPVSSRYSGMLE
jgi:hypothetical protein